MEMLTKEKLAELLNSREMKRETLEIDGLGAVTIRELDGLQLMDLNDAEGTANRLLLLLRYGLVMPEMTERECTELFRKMPREMSEIAHAVLSLTNRKLAAEPENR